MRKKLLATILTCTMIFATMGTTAFAAENPTGEVTDPKRTETTEGDGKVLSKGEATMEGDTPDTLTVVGDDDDPIAGDAEGKTDINVWAKVIDASTPLYKVDVAWGAMKFEYSSGAGKWNAETHTYDTALGNAVQGWTVDNYLDGENNKITVTNHSNAAIDTKFAFDFDNTGNKDNPKTAFNDSPTSEDAVQGNFFADNKKAAAAAVLADTTTVSDKLADSKLTIETADNEEAIDGTGIAKSADAYFAFSGTPDEGKGAVLTTFQKVGVIKLTIAVQTAE